MDGATLISSDASGLDKTISGISLMLNAATAGLAPNVGPIVRGARRGQKAAAKFVATGSDIAHEAKVAEKVVDDAVDASDAAVDAARALEKVEDAETVAQDGAKLAEDIRGGAHADTSKPIGDGMDSHHMPADSVTSWTRGEGHVIKMDPANHKLTASYGKKGAAYRAKQKKLIDQGKLKEAFQMDVDDIHSNFGDKYDEAIAQASEYLEQLLKDTQ